MVAEPVRTCVACGHKYAKSTLLRFVWSDEAPMRDDSGHAAGRGAYCCRDESCIQRFVKQKKKWKRVFRL